MVLVVSCINSTSEMAHCESIRVPICQNMPYNSTRMPNLLNHATQEDSLIALEPFELLVESACSPYLVFFLCSLLAPMCTEELGFKQEIPPCQHLCFNVKFRCESIIKRIGLIWPASMDCKTLPSKETGVCLTPETLFLPDAVPPLLAKNPDNCRCHRHPKLKRRLYQKRKFHYAIRGRVQISETFGRITVTNVRVIEVYKRGRVSLEPNSVALLWTNSSCGTCPRLEQGREYFMLGHESVEDRRLIFTTASVALEWRKKYVKLMKKWEEELRKG